ncbi:Chromate resistance protein ChrB [Actinopolymorpha alba]|uniref:Chromate resistance protein ChrB n=1 Tax=Actinopolymorpha alba TaxID=533267 RepID=UPI001ED9C4F3|nr:Chromate resistance protein ChrB [Actinopolymorpha alba]
METHTEQMFARQPTQSPSARSGHDRADGDSACGPLSWYLLVYRTPSGSSRARVAIWRDLKRAGALYLQHAVCVLPIRPEVRDILTDICGRIDSLDGSYHLFELSDIGAEQEDRLVDGFRNLAGREYAEIIEECATKFVKEIEFERFRENYTAEEAEEIRQDLEKIHRWFARVTERDWFGGNGRTEAMRQIAHCERLLEEFEEDVYLRTAHVETTTADSESAER